MGAKKEIRFYVCLILGYALLVWGGTIPPEGEVSKSFLIGAGFTFCVGAATIGIDVAGILHEITEMIKVLKQLPKAVEEKK